MIACSQEIFEVVIGSREFVFSISTTPAASLHTVLAGIGAGLESQSFSIAEYELLRRDASRLIAD